MTELSFTQASDLRTRPATLLAGLTMCGVNRELRPLVSMTAPGEWRDRPILQWPVQQRLFSSWILLLGLIPIDRHVFYFHAIDPDRGFTEGSASIINRLWRHRRWISPLDGGCRVVDTVSYESRLPGLGHLFKPVYRLVFWHRHRKLRRRFGRLGSQSRGL
jgi:hypothetical protein